MLIQKIIELLGLCTHDYLILENKSRFEHVTILKFAKCNKIKTIRNL